MAIACANDNFADMYSSKSKWVLYAQKDIEHLFDFLVLRLKDIISYIL